MATSPPKLPSTAAPAASDAAAGALAASVGGLVTGGLRDVSARLGELHDSQRLLAGTVAAKAPSLLNRHQTEEWKGWMQVRGREGGGGGVMGLMRA